MKEQRVWLHSDRRPGKLLRFKDDSLKFVLPSGAQLNVLPAPDGTLKRRLKLNKKQRRKLKASTVQP